MKSISEEALLVSIKIRGAVQLICGESIAN